MRERRIEGEIISPTLKWTSALFAMAFGVGFALAICAVSPASAFASDNDNSWQIVEREYDPSYTTSEGLSSSELDDHNYVESDDDQVRVSKSIEATGVEDEFIIHLSIDTTATSKQVTDYKTYFENAPYYGTTSNGFHDFPEGSVTSQQKGTMDVKVSGKPGEISGGNASVFNIRDPQGRIIAENVTLRWSQAENITIILEVVKNKYIIMGIKVKSGQTNDLWLSEEAYKLVQEAIAGEVKQGDPTLLNGVRDPIGDNMEYLGDANADGGTVTYNESEHTLYWGAGSESELGSNPIEYSDSCKKVVEDPVVTEERNTYGAVTKVVVTQRTCYYGAASLSYRVRLKTDQDGFASSYDPANITNPYNANANSTYGAAQLNYTYYTEGGESSGTGDVSFPEPKVKGILYDLKIKKTNEIGTPLAGATFKLTRTWTDSFGKKHSDVVSKSLTSDSDGYVIKTSLPWGTYTLEEIEPPSGHTMPEDSADRSATFKLCYTRDKSVLMASSITSESEHHASQRGDEIVIVNERVKTDVSLLKIDSETSEAIKGAKFALYADDGDGSYSEKKDLIPANKLFELETGEDGIVVFEQLTVGTYYLKETYTPAGYELNDKVFRIDVYDVKGEAGGSADNMIRVGLADGSNMQPPNTPNTVTVADRPIPDLPVTAGPGIGSLLGGGFVLVAIGCAGIALCAVRFRRRLNIARHRNS